MKVLLVGSGAREHALAWKIAQSPLLNTLFIAPGNPGTAHCGTNTPIDALDIPRLLGFAQEECIDLTVVGPDDMLAAGIVDVFRAKGLQIFGPTKAAAQIESSKVFAKTLMREHGIPTAHFATFSDYENARAYVREHGAPIVVKASGLALGKGVFVCKTVFEAEQALTDIMRNRRFSSAGNEVVVEEYLIGPEVSIHALCAGTDFLLFPPSQDHKRIGEGDTGPNTGGMGTIVPVPFVSNDLLRHIGEDIVRPTLTALAEQGIPFTGLLYPGLILTDSGPKVIEFNARFGDPETQVYMRLLKSDVLPILDVAARGDISHVHLEWHAGAATNIVLASSGYPEAYSKDIPIHDLSRAESIEGVVVFHAGTRDVDGVLQTNGGRVFGVSAVGESIDKALERAYQAADTVSFEGKYMRRDIGMTLR